MTESVTAEDLQRVITSQRRTPGEARRVSLYGVEMSMEDSWNLASACYGAADPAD